MLKQLNISYYKFIIQFEMIVWTKYKIDPFDFESRLTILDLQFYSNTLTNQIERENKENSNNKLLKSLMAIRDILNYMSLPEH